MRPGAPDDRQIHAPNEKLYLDSFENSIRMNRLLLDEIARAAT